MVDTKDARRERIAELKRAIAEGTYETPEKLEVAVDALLDDLQRRERESGNENCTAPSQPK